jgi:WD repeat-containing protein 19
VLEFPSNQTPRIDDLAWDKDNDSLAILTQTHVISIWSMGQRKFQDIELASQKDLACYISWSRTHPVLVVGTEKGSLVFFNRKSQRKIPCISKHGKAVRHGDWNVEGYLMSASADKMLTVSNHQGDTPFDSLIVKGEPTNVRWCPYQDDKSKWVTVIINSQKLFMFNPVDGQSHFIETEKSYGKITCFEWLNHQYIVVGYSTGVVNVLAMSLKNLGKEMKDLRPSGTPIEAICINQDLDKVAVASMGSIKFYSTKNWIESSEDRIDISKNSG